jgi:hypothetical protein
MKRSSKRFTPTWWSERMVPVILALLALALLLTLGIILLSVLGVFPS